MTVINVRFGDQDTAIEGFRGPAVCQIADITYRQLDYWARTALADASVRPAKGSGTTRIYSESDVLRICLVSTLLSAGLNLDTIRAGLDGLVRSADIGIGIITAPNVVITVDIAALQGRIQQYKAVS